MSKISIRSKKKKKKEKLPAPFSEPAKPDDLGDLDDLDELPPELLDELKNYEPTEEEIAAEFERLKAEEDKKKKKKQKVEITFLRFLRSKLTSFFSMIEIGALNHGHPRRDIRPNFF